MLENKVWFSYLQKGIILIMNFFKKWYTYQRERFPIIVYGLYVFCIVFAVFCFCNYCGQMSYGEPQLFNMYSVPTKLEWGKLIPMFITAFLQFLMIRIVDEFKDYEEDLKYRPYRPVPRGLITLGELKVLLIFCLILQFFITLVFNKMGGIGFLILLWLYFALLGKDFFIEKFTSKHILIGVFLDELLMPLLVLYLASFIYIDYGSIWRILLMLYIVSWIVEIARKIRCKDDEEKGVKTYTAVFGINFAVLILVILEILLMIVNIIILQKIYWSIFAFTVVCIIDILFTIKKNRMMAKMTELSANIYIILACLSMGVLII